MGVVVAFEDKEAGQGSGNASGNARIETLIELTRADMDRVNAMIVSRTGSAVTMIPEVANHLISSGGKRLRPMLTLATATLSGYRGEGHVKLAAEGHDEQLFHEAAGKPLRLLDEQLLEFGDILERRAGELTARIDRRLFLRVVVGVTPAADWVVRFECEAGRVDE